MVITTIVPIQLISDINETIWENTHPSSTAYCRPVSISLEKETEEYIRKEKLHMDTEIEALQDSTINLPSNKV